MTTRSTPSRICPGTHFVWFFSYALAAILGLSSLQGQTEPALSATSPEAPSSSPAAPDAPKPTVADERRQVELLESYQYLREQLRTAQLSIAHDRVDAQESVRRQTADLTAKLEAMKVTLAAVNKRQQEDAFRFEYDRIHQQEQSLRSSRSLLWIAGIVGGSVLLTLLIIARVQWHAMNRIAEAVTAHPLLLAQNNPGWLPPGKTSPLSEKAVADSTQRLASAMERIERRIGHLEQTANPPPAPPMRERRVFPADT